MTEQPALTADHEDAELMRRVQAGDPDAFGDLYDRFAVRALRVAYVRTRDRSRAEEVVQEAFLSVWRSRSHYRAASGSVGGWIMGIVQNRSIDSLRRTARDQGHRADDSVLDTAPAPGGVPDTVVERDEAARLRVTLARLPAAQRDVIALAYFGELSTSEIASELKLPLGTVKGRIRLGLDKLRAETLPPRGPAP